MSKFSLVTGSGVLLFVLTLAVCATGNDTQEKTGDTEAKVAAVDTEYKPKTREELREVLTDLQFQVTQNASTERAFANEYWDNTAKGTYLCRCCNYPLFSSVSKYKSGTGWPSFFAPIKDDAVGLKTDWKLFYPRKEVHCKRCKAHLGHVFDDGPQPTGKRYCMNSASMKFVKEKSSTEKATVIESK